MSDSPIVIVEKVQLRRGLQIELPGKPIQTNPLRLAEGLSEGELGFTIDTGRLFVGHKPRVGDVNFNRPVFPYQNVEVLTENSPRVREMFEEYIRDQENDDFFSPTIVAAGYTGNLTYADLPAGSLIPSKFYGESVSVVVEYHAFHGTTGYPIKQGTLRIVANNGAANIFEESVEDPALIGGGLTFSLSGRSSDGQGFFYTLRLTNSTGVSVKLHLRRVVIVGLAAALDPDTPQ